MGGIHSAVPPIFLEFLKAAQLLSDFQPGLVPSLLNKVLLHFSLVAVGMDSIEVRDRIGFRKGAGPVT